MKKIILAFFIIALNTSLFAQPYIMSGSGDGIGQYGYLELDVNTFSNLNRDNHGNVKHLGARWWVTDGSGGEEHIYWTTPNDNNWQCNADNSSNKSTNNYSPADFNGEFIAGSDCYVSVYSEYCSGSQNTSGFNERHLQVLDLDNSAYTDIVDNVLYDASGDCNHDNLVGSFTIDPGALVGISLTRFWFKNIGTALEGTDIPNDAFKVFYEPVTGSETFDKTEDAFMVYGDYNSNSTSNNEYGNDAVSALVDGNTRFYVTMCKVNLPSSNGKTVELVILNDGISFDPLLDGFGLFRMGETNISNQAITIPITLIDFSAKLNRNGYVDISWSTASEVNNSHFNIYKSHDALNWENIGRIESNNKQFIINNYALVDNNPFQGFNYYKLEQVDLDGSSKMFGIVLVDNNDKKYDFEIYPNPANSKLKIISLIKNAKIEIINNLGEIVKVESITNRNELDISDLSSGLFYIVLRDKDNRFIRTKSFIHK